MQGSLLNFKAIENTWGDFDGTSTQWQGFHDRFKAAIHDNENLSGAYKFMYLRKSLKGKAIGALGEWQLTDSNYAEAWERLKELYQRDYQISAELLRKFHSLPKIDRANSAIIQKFSNVTHEMLRQLRALDYPVEHYDLFVVHSVHEKLDAETAKAWELFRSSEKPTAQELLKFLDREAKALSNVHPYEQNKAKEFRKRKMGTQETALNPKRTRLESKNGQTKGEQRTVWNCKVCNERHLLHKCPTFLKMNLSNRRKCIKDHELCMNCFKPFHISRDCYGGACVRCNIKHNSLLCPENPVNRLVATMQSSKAQENQDKKGIRKEQKIHKKPNEQCM